MLQFVDHALYSNFSFLLGYLDLRSLQENQNAVVFVQHFHCQLVVNLAELVDELQRQIDGLLVLGKFNIFASHRLSEHR